MPDVGYILWFNSRARLLWRKHYPLELQYSPIGGNVYRSEGAKVIF